MLNAPISYYFVQNNTRIILRSYGLHDVKLDKKYLISVDIYTVITDADKRNFVFINDIKNIK